MQKILYLFCCLLILSSCMTDFETNNYIQSFQGRNISFLVRKLGYPSEEKRSLIDNKKIFIWSTDRRSSSITIKSQSSGSTYGNKWEAISSATNSLNQGMNNIAERNSYCIIKVITNDNNIIEYVEYSGWLCNKYLNPS